MRKEFAGTVSAGKNGNRCNAQGDGSDPGPGSGVKKSVLIFRFFLGSTVAVWLLAACGSFTVGTIPPERLLSAARNMRPGTVPVALVNATVIDGTGNGPLDDAVVVFMNGRILEVGPRGTVGLPDNCRVVDLGGAYVLPGIVNAHVHNAFWVRHAELFAENGVTTVRDLHCERDAIEKAVAFRDVARRDPRLCRILSAGALITARNGYKADAGLAVNSESEAALAVDREIAAGTDFIKIIIESPTGPGSTALRPALASFITARAHEAGIPVTAHVLTSRDLEIALDAGVDDIAHIVVDELPDVLVERLVKTGIPLEPTLTDWATSVGTEREIILSNFRRLTEAGAVIALGAEHIHTAKNAGPFIGLPIQEFLMMREGGMTPMQIIVASTRNAARACRLDEELGTLETGKAADILVLSRNPLEDLNAFTDIRMVIRGGVVIRD